MNVEEIFALAILSYCALIFILIGIWVIKSKEAHGFWTGAKSPQLTQTEDIPVYNKKHGKMYILYGVGMPLTYIWGVFIEPVWAQAAYILILVETLGGLAVMILCHQYWYHTYVSKPEKSL